MTSTKARQAERARKKARADARSKSQTDDLRDILQDRSDDDAETLAGAILQRDALLAAASGFAQGKRHV
jgi:F0F1-type ATP synthase membrane subunit b/b'